MKTQPLIFLDAGHGDKGGDFGACYDNTRESDITLKFAQALELELMKLGYRVLQTREKTVSDLPMTNHSLGDLPARVDMANKNMANLYISLHCNASTSSQASGMEIYYYPTSWASEKLAYWIENEIKYIKKVKKAKTIPAEKPKMWDFGDRGTKRGRFYVLSQTNCPAVLIETLFLSNIEDRARLKNRDFQKSFAFAIANGIDRYLQQGGNK